MGTKKGRRVSGWTHWRGGDVIGFIMAKDGNSLRRWCMTMMLGTNRTTRLSFRVVESMHLSVSSLRLRRVSILVMVASALVALVAVPSVRQPLLRTAGWALVINKEPVPAEIIVISLDSGGAGVLEAADLVQSGIATRVAVFTDTPSREDYEFIQRGFPYEDASTRQIRQLKSLGVTDIAQIRRTEAGTEGSAQALPPWCDQHQFRSILFVAARDHSRRSQRVLDRAMKGHPTRVTVQPTRYSNFDPDRWWKTHDGVRTEIVELQKLVLDLILHPTSF
jgi:uncharacterized SAM-binding protein YcdF (DUF218 family)